MHEPVIKLDPVACPSCGTDFPDDLRWCRPCDLWWSRSRADSIRLSCEGEEEAAPPARFLLPRHAWGGAVVFLLLSGLGLGALMASVWMVVGEPSTGMNWVRLVAGLVVGGAVGTACGSVATLLVLGALRPSYLEAVGDRLRLRFWKEGFWRPFRSEGSLSLNGIEGVELNAGQGGWDLDTTIILVHASGLRICLDSGGSKARAERIGQALLRWISSHRRAVGFPSLRDRPDPSER